MGAPTHAIAAIGTIAAAQRDQDPHEAELGDDDAAAGCLVRAGAVGDETVVTDI